MSAIVAPRLSDGVASVRGLAQADVPDIVAACSDPEIPRWTRVPSPYTREDAAQFVAAVSAEAAGGHGIALALCAAGEDRLVGTIGVMEIDHAERYCEIGYWTAAPARGRGLTSRAVVLVRDWAHAALGMTTIELLPHRDNLPSQRVAERAGFADTGVLRTVARMPPGRREGYKVYVWRAPA